MSRFTNYMPDEKGNWYIAKCPTFEEGQKCSVGIGGTGTVAVSYTHLDVYKRQGWSHPPVQRGYCTHESNSWHGCNKPK